jgi:hypothetical protein
MCMRCICCTSSGGPPGAAAPGSAPGSSSSSIHSLLLEADMAAMSTVCSQPLQARHTQSDRVRHDEEHRADRTEPTTEKDTLH